MLSEHGNMHQVTNHSLDAQPLYRVDIATGIVTTKITCRAAETLPESIRAVIHCEAKTRDILLSTYGAPWITKTLLDARMVSTMGRVAQEVGLNRIQAAARNAIGLQLPKLSARFTDGDLVNLVDHELLSDPNTMDAILDLWRYWRARLLAELTETRAGNIVSTTGPEGKPPVPPVQPRSPKVTKRSKRQMPITA